MAVAGFNFGAYKEKSVFDKTSNYEIEAYATVEPPEYLRQNNFSLTPSAMAESAMVDAQNAIRLFQIWFGDAPYGRIALTQQPAFNFGQSWPTLVYLPISAFLDSTQRWILMGGSAFQVRGFHSGSDSARSVASMVGPHGGLGLLPRSMAFGRFADFSAGLFLQQVERKHDKYLKYWERARRR